VTNAELLDVAAALASLAGHDPRRVREQWSWRDVELFLTAWFEHQKLRMGVGQH